MTMDTDAFARERGAAGLPGSSLAYRTGSWRDHRPVHLHGRAPCHTHCPAGEDGQAWIQKLQERDPRGAFETILRANPLPATTGRICPHPCEDGCNRGRFDQPVAIHALERGTSAISRSKMAGGSTCRSSPGTGRWSASSAPVPRGFPPPGGCGAPASAA